MRERQANWPYRLLALGIALGLWWTTAAEKREPQSEKTLDASVTYNLPKGLVPLSRVSQVRLSVRGSKREIRRLRPFDIDVEVSLPTARAGPITVNLGEENVILPNDNLQVVAIEPKVLSLRLDTEVERTLPVFVEITGEPAAGAVLRSYRASPATAQVAGPASALATVRRLQTDRVSLDGHAFTFEKEVAVLAPDPLVRVLSPASVTVRVELDQPQAPR
ncbi:MAG TPA: CdaR family protein [Thermoanaerobaculia bacterium]|nr:CdaR family protein [Thermoanaerobaculia bacterium]